MIDTRKSTAYHPALQLIFLILLAVAGAIVFTALGMFGWLIVTRDITALTNFISGDFSNINFLRTMVMTGNSIGPFIAGPIAFAFLVGVKPKRYFYFDEPLNWKLVGLVIAIMFSSNALLEWTTVINQKMALPDFLQNLELWMKAKEEETAVLTKTMLTMNNYSDLIINLIMIGMLPAIGEELFFRGGIQNILGQWCKNHHVAIWVTAIIFSSIHLQFYGFLPRMLLGALFGYLLVYGKSIWLAILGHFLNNGTAVVITFIMQKQGKSLDEIDQSTSFPWYGYLISAIISLILLVVFFKTAQKEEEIISYE